MFVLEEERESEEKGGGGGFLKFLRSEGGGWFYGGRFLSARENRFGDMGVINEFDGDS